MRRRGGQRGAAQIRRRCNGRRARDDNKGKGRLKSDSSSKKMRRRILLPRLLSFTIRVARLSHQRKGHPVGRRPLRCAAVSSSLLSPVLLPLQHSNVQKLDSGTLELTSCLHPWRPSANLLLPPSPSGHLLRPPSGLPHRLCGPGPGPFCCWPRHPFFRQPW